MSIFSLSRHGADFRFAASHEELDELSNDWTGIEEMSVDPFADFDFEDRLLARLDAEREDDEMALTSSISLLLGSDWDFDDDEHLLDIKDWYRNQISQLEEDESIAAKEAAINLERELEVADSHLPSFSNNQEPMHRVTDERSCRRRNRHNDGRKMAKFRISGKRGRKDKRSHRTGNRQEFAAMHDICSDYYGELEKLAHEWNPPAIRQFDIELVGLTLEEALFYEAEAQHDADEYERELEMASWYWLPEPDYSHLFAPIRSIEQYQWEQEEYPTQYADVVFSEFNRIHHINQFSYRFTSWDYYDDDMYMGDFYHDSYDDHQPYDDSYDDDFKYDDGPTLEEWLAIDEHTEQRMHDDAAENFFPRFGSTVVKRKVRGYDQDAKLPEKRSKAHTTDRGWRRFAPKRHHGRDSIRHLPTETTPRYNATQYLSDNAGMNLH